MTVDVRLEGPESEILNLITLLVEGLHLPVAMVSVSPRDPLGNKHVELEIR